MPGYPYKVGACCHLGLASDNTEHVSAGMLVHFDRNHQGVRQPDHLHLAASAESRLQAVGCYVAVQGCRNLRLAVEAVLQRSGAAAKDGLQGGRSPAQQAFLLGQ